VAEVSAALSAWCKRLDRDPKRTAIWICSLCPNRHVRDWRDWRAPRTAPREGSESSCQAGLPGPAAMAHHLSRRCHIICQCLHCFYTYL